MSNRDLTTTEHDALSLGLKFATGTHTNNLTEIITKNYRHTDTDFNKGFIQGIITASTHTTYTEHTLPRRYITALRTLAADHTIHITPSDKGGGIVLLDTHTYNNKMTSLLADEDTYELVNKTLIDRETDKFNKSIKSLLKNQYKSWSKLIDHHPKLPKMYGLPKIHKPNTPVRPIISGIGSAPHKIARKLAKTLSPLLGKISTSHLKNSGDLINRIRDLNMENKLMASLDVTSLYTNIPVKKCLDSLNTYLNETNTKLDLPTDTIIKLCTLVTNQCFFESQGTTYKQKFGLPMGSPLSGVLACLYLEFLESGPFKYIIPENALFLRYIDDALLIYPRHVNLENLVARLNDIEPSINFTYECESNATLAYLDVLLHRTGNTLQRSVFRKPTNKNDHIHFYSHHTTKIKSGLIIGFYLRALRICTPQHLDNEEKYLERSFKALHYPQSFIHRARMKAHKIHNKKDTNQTNQETTKRITLPTNSITTHLSKHLNKLDFNVTLQTSTTIRSILNKPHHNQTPPSEAGIYKVPCRQCDSFYIGETSRCLKKRIYEHRRALVLDNQLNALVQHRNLMQHNPDLSKAQIIKYARNPQIRKCLEAAIISTCCTIPQRPGSFQIAPILARLITAEHKITPHLSNNQLLEAG